MVQQKTNKKLRGIGVMGCKIKMGRFEDPFKKGKSIPVTFIEIARCEIINQKTSMLEGYNSNYNTILALKTQYSYCKHVINSIRFNYY